MNARTLAQAKLEQYIDHQADSIAPEPSLEKVAGGSIPPATFRKQTHVPQRKARYSDRTRIRRRDVQGWVFHSTGARTTAQIKAALKKLGKKLDLRLSAAWMEIDLNWASAIAQIVKRLRALDLVGKKVTFRSYCARTAHWEAWSPFLVVSESEGKARLDMLRDLISFDDLVAC